MVEKIDIIKMEWIKQLIESIVAIVFIFGGIIGSGLLIEKIDNLINFSYTTQNIIFPLIFAFGILISTSGAVYLISIMYDYCSVKERREN